MKRAKKTALPTTTVTFNPSTMDFTLELSPGHLLTISDSFTVVEVLRGHGVKGVVYKHPHREPVILSAVHQLEHHFAEGF